MYILGRCTETKDGKLSNTSPSLKNLAQLREARSEQHFMNFGHTNLEGLSNLYSWGLQDYTRFGCLQYPILNMGLKDYKNRNNGIK